MEELYKILKEKLQEMREQHLPVVGIDFHELAKMYQLVCMMKQIKEIVEWEK